MGKLKNYIKQHRPYRRYRNPNLSLSERFEVLEEKGHQWREEVLKTFNKRTLLNDLKRMKLTAFTRLNFYNEDLYELIQAFTRDSVTDEDFDNFSDFLVKRHKQLREIKREGREALTITPNRGKSILVLRLSEFSPEITQDYPEITSLDRIGGCHDYSIEVTRKMPDEAVCVTGKIHLLSPKYTVLHSWIETKLKDETEYVLDLTANCFIRKADYYKIWNAKPMTKTTQKVLRDDKEWLNELLEFDDLYIKMYLLNREEAYEKYLSFMGLERE